jgi:hypothetical protein
LQFGQRRLGLLLNRGASQRPFWSLQLRLGAPTVPRGQVLPGPMQAKHLFDQRHPDAKQSGDFRNRKIPVFDRGHHSGSQFCRIRSHTVPYT